MFAYAYTQAPFFLFLSFFENRGPPKFFPLLNLFLPALLSNLTLLVFFLAEILVIFLWRLASERKRNAPLRLTSVKSFVNAE